MKATIYIPEDKSQIYKKAKAELADSVSATFLRCLERELENQRIQTGRIVVEISDKEDQIAKKAFEGRWLIGGAGAGEMHGGGQFSVALTKKNQIAVFTWDKYDLIRWYRVYSDFDDFSTADEGDGGFPPGLISSVAAELKIDHIEEMDI